MLEILHQINSQTGTSMKSPPRRRVGDDEDLVHHWLRQVSLRAPLVWEASQPAALRLISIKVSALI